MSFGTLTVQSVAQRNGLKLRTHFCGIYTALKWRNFAWFQDPAAVWVRPTLLWGFTRRRMVVTDVLGQPIGPIFKVRTVQKDFLTPEDGSDRLSRNVGNYHSTLRKTPREGGFRCVTINLLAPELHFFLILAHPVYKMWIIQEPNTLELWNKLHFEGKKVEYIPCLKYSVPVFVE